MAVGIADLATCPAYSPEADLRRKGEGGEGWFREGVSRNAERMDSSLGLGMTGGLGGAQRPRPTEQDGEARRSGVYETATKSPGTPEAEQGQKALRRRSG